MDKIKVEADFWWPRNIAEKVNEIVDFINKYEEVLRYNKEIYDINESEEMK